MAAIEAVASAASAGGDFWDTLGPYLMTGAGIMAATIVAGIWKDVLWCKRNITNVLVQLGIKPVSED